MAEKKFSELETAANLDGSEYAAVSQSQNGVLTSVKATLQAIANWIASGSRYASALNTQDKTLTGAINEVLSDAGSDVSVTNTIPSSDETKRVATVTIDGTPTDINADDTEAILRRVFGEHIVEGNPVTFDAYLGLETVKSLTLTMNPIQEGTGDPSPTNIRPISGRDSVDVVVTGINQWDEQWELGGLDSVGQLVPVTNRIRSKNYIRLFSGESYYVKTALASTDIRIAFYDAEKAFISNSSWITSGIITAPSNALYAKFVVANLSTYNNNISINYPSTDTEYHAYNGQTHTATFPNTVYGGKVDFVSGEGSNEWGHIASYNGETLPGYWISDRDVYAEGTTPTTGAEVCYELATPTTFSTIPTPIPLNKGNNVVSSDADELELKYSVG